MYRLKKWFLEGKIIYVFQKKWDPLTCSFSRRKPQTIAKNTAEGLFCRIQLSSASSEVEEIANNVNNTFTWTDEFRSMLGYQNEKDFPNVLDSWSSRLYPEDHDRSLAALSDHLLDYTGKTPYDVQYRLKLKHGEYRWFRATGTTIRDQQGVADELTLKIHHLSDSITEMVNGVNSVSNQAQELATAQEQSTEAANQAKVSTVETQNISNFIKEIAIKRICSV